MNRVDPALLFCAVALLLTGLVMVYSASAALSADAHDNTIRYVRVQLIAAVLGLMVGLAAMRIPPRRYARLAKRAVIAAFVLMLCVYLPLIGVEVNGFRRWIHLGFTRFQPVEFAKIALILYVARFLSLGNRNVRSLTMGVLPNIVVMLGFVALLIAQPDFGSGALLCGIVFVMLLAGGARISHLVMLGLIAAVPTYFLIVTNEYRVQRVMTFLEWIGGTRAVPDDRGYQIWQSYNALSNGGLFGVGVGESVHKLFYLPAPHTDFVFTVVGEEMGFIGGAAIIVLFMALVARGVKIALRCQDRFVKMLAFGISISFGLQAFVNIAMTLGLLPTKGFTLPFLSYGGSSLMISIVLVCVLLNISRYVKWHGVNE